MDFFSAIDNFLVKMFNEYLNKDIWKIIFQLIPNDLQSLIENAIEKNDFDFAYLIKSLSSRRICVDDMIEDIIDANGPQYKLQWVLENIGNPSCDLILDFFENKHFEYLKTMFKYSRCFSFEDFFYRSSRFDIANLRWILENGNIYQNERNDQYLLNILLRKELEKAKVLIEYGFYLPDKFNLEYLLNVIDDPIFIEYLIHENILEKGEVEAYYISKRVEEKPERPSKKSCFSRILKFHLSNPIQK